MNVIFDNNLSPRLARAINELDAENTVVPLRALFKPDVADVEWMLGLSQSGNWIALTGDYRISRNPHEAAAWNESGLVFFFLRPSWQDLPFWEYVSKLTRRWPSIMALASQADPGDGFDVTIRSSTVRKI